MVPAAIVVAILALIALRSLVRVPDDSQWVVEKLGRYSRTLPPGTHFVLPFLERITVRHSRLVHRDSLDVRAITNDNVVVQVASMLQWQIVDARAATYGVADVAQAMRTLIESKQREWMAARRWNDVRESTRELESAMISSVEDVAQNFGVKVVSFEVSAMDRG